MIVKVGYIGLGTMGEPMAANLLKAGFEVVIVGHRNPAPVERLRAAGARVAATPAEVAAQVDALMLCLPDDAVVEQVLCGPEGVLAGARAGLIVLDTSTISPLTAQRLARLAAEKGVTLLDAPVSGGQGGAMAGTLAVMVGGPEDAFRTTLPVLQAVGQSITHIGAHGAALVVKLANNLIVAAQLVAISEALTMAKVAGIDTRVVHQVLSASTSRSWILQEKTASSILAGNLQPGFKLALMRKDVGLALAHGAALKTPMFATALLHQLYLQAEGLGKGGLDSIGICELYTDATGVDLKAGS